MITIQYFDLTTRKMACVL